MPIDLLPNLNQVVTPIMRTAEQMPKDLNAQVDWNRKYKFGDVANREAAEENRAITRLSR